MNPLKKLDSFRYRKEVLERAKEAWLRDQGWECSSDYPSSLWLWSKDFPQSTVQWRWRGAEKVPHPGFSLRGVSMDVALRIEAAWLDLWVSGDHAEPEPANGEGG